MQPDFKNIAFNSFTHTNEKPFPTLLEKSGGY